MLMMEKFRLIPAMMLVLGQGEFNSYEKREEFSFTYFEFELPYIIQVESLKSMKKYEFLFHQKRL